MPGVPWTRRLIRQVFPRTDLRDCCWHHSVDWRQASHAALRIVRQVRREGITGMEAMDDRVIELLDTTGLDEPELTAVGMLAWLDCGIDLARRGYSRRLSYYDGRKRSHALLEAGVHRTVTVQWRDLDS
jgi:hypothetical protein